MRLAQESVLPDTQRRQQAVDQIKIKTPTPILCYGSGNCLQRTRHRYDEFLGMGHQPVGVEISFIGKVRLNLVLKQGGR